MLVKYTFFAFFVFLCLLSIDLRGQNYPVTSVTQLSKPYSLRLTDYGEGNGERVTLNLYLQDVLVSNYAVRLRLHIEGVGISLVTKPTYIGRTESLTGGVLNTLSGLDLADYFNPNNLVFQGYSRSQYDQTGKLPEGVYTMRFEVLDAVRGLSVASPTAGQSVAWLAESDPPLLNTPFEAETVRALSIQNVIFQWTPRHLSSPNAPALVDYELTLVQLIPKTRNPNDAILTGNPIFNEIVTGTNYVYGISDPSLILGEKYAWRVRVKDKNGLDIFKNRGYSVVQTFTHGEACFMPTDVASQLLSPTRAKINYTAGAGNSRFVVRFREKKTDNSGVWFEEVSQLNYCNLNDLQPNTEYEYEVNSFCGSLSPVGFATLETFKTANFSANDFACGRVPAVFSLANQLPKLVLERGDVIKATEFEIEVGRVSGGNGIFSGEGVVVLPFMNNLKVNAVFTNIKINTDNKMIDGKIAITGATAQALTDDQMADVNAMMTEIESTLNAIESTIQEIDAVLDKIDAVTGKLYDYLPEDLQLNLSSARDSLTSAKADLKNLPANATIEQKNAAKDKVRRAKQAVRTALLAGIAYYQQALIKFVNIIWQTLVSLKTEYFGSQTATQQELDAAGEAVIAHVFDAQNVPRPTATDVEEDIFIIKEFSFDMATPTDAPRQSVETKFKNFNKAIKKERLAKFMFAMLAFYLSADDVKENFKDDSILKGGQIIEDILQSLRQRKSEEVITLETKDKIVKNIDEMIEDLISKK